MDAPREVELKFSLSEDGLHAMERAPLLSALRDKARTRSTVSVYFDTEGSRLRRKGVSLRVRRDGDRRLQTVKAEGKSGIPFERREWERRIRADVPDLKRVRATGLKLLRKKKELKGLKPVFTTAMERTTIPVRRPGGTVEV